MLNYNTTKKLLFLGRLGTSINIEKLTYFSHHLNSIIFIFFFAHGQLFLLRQQLHRSMLIVCCPISVKRKLEVPVLSVLLYRVKYNDDLTSLRHRHYIRGLLIQKNFFSEQWHQVCSYM